LVNGFWRSISFFAFFLPALYHLSEFVGLPFEPRVMVALGDQVFFFDVVARRVKRFFFP
jgi:hypothetical protein